MEQTLRELIVANGFKAVYEQLEVLKGEYKQFYEAQIAFMNEFTLPTLIEVAPTPPPTPALMPIAQSDVKQIAIPEQVLERAEVSDEGKEIVIEQAVPAQEKKKMKVIRKGNKTIHVPERPKVAELVSEQLPERLLVAEPIVEQVENTFTEVKPQPKRSSAEMKKWQREQEAARRTYMKENKISRSSLMTEENVRKWIEEEGNSYAWVAREQLGCKEEDVSIFAKKHKIVRKR